MNNPQISIIVPVYNVEQYLPRCIDSILAQSFDDFELLLVDDGSTDSSGKICDNYTSKDERVYVVHKENGGVSSARNAGLDIAKGKWIYFVDSDDVILPNALETFMSYIKSKSKFVMAGFTISEENGILVEQPKGLKYCELSILEALKEMYVPSDFRYQGFLWCKLFKREVVQHNHLRFDERISFNEDRLFIVEYLCCCNEYISYTTTPVYNYIMRDCSAMGTLNRVYNKKFATDFDAFVLMYKRIAEYTKDKELIRLALNGICDSYKSIHKMMLKYNQYDREIHKHMLRSMFRIGALPQYIKSITRPFLCYLGLLLFPSIIIKYSNK